MFTGLIEEIGVVTAFIRSSQSAKLSLGVSKNLADVKLGESIAINGVCLTVSKVRRNTLDFDLSLESLNRSTLTDLRVGDRVHLERALTLAGRLGGHLVTGHIDGVGEIRKKVKFDDNLELFISVPSGLLIYLVPKGSITIDGVSLTVTDLRDGLLVITVVPHTAKVTLLKDKDVGQRLNIEVDILSKYIEKHLKGEMNKGFNDDLLTRVGFLPLGWTDN